MTRMRLTLRLGLGLVLATAALAATACGGGGSQSVPEGAVAVVDGTDVSKADLDSLIAQAKRGYAAQKQQFPKVGTAEFQSIQTQYVAYLVELAEFRQAAAKLGAEVTPKDIDAAEKDLIKSRFSGKPRRVRQGAQAAGLHARVVPCEGPRGVGAVEEDLRPGDEGRRPCPSRTSSPTTRTNQAQYGTPESRDVRHILISIKDSKGNVDYGASKAKADKIYAELKSGADFAKLAKANSDDPGSKDTGGKLTISRGQTVPEFDKVSFDLATGALSKPVKTQYGYHVIEAVSNVRKAKTTPLDKVRATIKTTLLQQKRNETMQAWVSDLQKRYKGKVSYAAGYEPPALPDTTSTQ